MSLGRSGGKPIRLTRDPARTEARAGREMVTGSTSASITDWSMGDMEGIGRWRERLFR